MAGLTSTGFEIKTLEIIEGQMDDSLHSGISPTLNLTSTSAYGQLKSVTASHTSEVWDAALALYMSWDADSATGAALDRLGTLTGTRRRAATASTAVMTLSLLAGTYEPGDLVVTKIGDGTVRFSNDEEIILASDDSSVEAVFSSEEAGPVAALAHELTVIEPVAGFVSADNASAAITGKPTESDTDYRRRRALELALKGSTTVDAIRADMLQILNVDGEPLFDFVSVVENDTDNFVDGRPPHSFETMIIGGTSQQIAEALLSLKPAGIRSFGNTIVSVSDSQGNFHDVGFTRPTDYEINFALDLTVIESQFPGLQTVEDTVRAFFLENQSVGYDVIHARYVQVVMGVPGVVDAEVHITNTTYPVGGPQANQVVGPREIAVLGDAIPGGITGTVTGVGGIP